MFLKYVKRFAGFFISFLFSLIILLVFEGYSLFPQKNIFILEEQRLLFTFSFIFS